MSILTENSLDFLKFILMTKIPEKIPEFSEAKREKTSAQAPEGESQETRVGTGAKRS